MHVYGYVCVLNASILEQSRIGHGVRNKHMTESVELALIFATASTHMRTKRSRLRSFHTRFKWTKNLDHSGALDAGKLEAMPTTGDDDGGLSCFLVWYFYSVNVILQVWNASGVVSYVGVGQSSVQDWMWSIIEVSDTEDYGRILIFSHQRESVLREYCSRSLVEMIFYPNLLNEKVDF
jgi:hypothetical protein